MKTESDHREPGTRRSTLAWMGPTTVALLAALVLLGVERDGPTPPTVTAAPEPSAAAGLLDHSTIDRRDLVEEPEQSQLSVAAYGD
jgi:hypothetical protein